MTLCSSSVTIVGRVRWFPVFALRVPMAGWLSRDYSMQARGLGPDQQEKEATIGW
jgi:hypothetical protein